MPNIRLLSLASVLVFTLVVLALFEFSPNDLSGYGGIVSAGGSLLAVIWFSASLWYQSQQLNEQRTQLNEQRVQFLAEFKHLQDTSRRDSLQLAKTILDAAEEKALAQIGGASSVSDILTQYIYFKELKPILESDDPEIVLTAYKAWSQKEGAALTLLKGIKNAAEIHLRTIEGPVIDFTKTPEDFVYIYGCWFWSKPFFEVYQGPITALCELMINLEPGRHAAHIANIVAFSKSCGARFVHQDKIRESIQKHLDKGYKLPKIAEGY